MYTSSPRFGLGSKTQRDYVDSPRGRPQSRQGYQLYSNFNAPSGVVLAKAQAAATNKAKLLAHQDVARHVATIASSRRAGEVLNASNRSPAGQAASSPSQRMALRTILEAVEIMGSDFNAVAGVVQRTSINVRLRARDYATLLEELAVPRSNADRDEIVVGRVCKAIIGIGMRGAACVLRANIVSRVLARFCLMGDPVDARCVIGDGWDVPNAAQRPSSAGRRRWEAIGAAMRGALGGFDPVAFRVLARSCVRLGCPYRQQEAFAQARDPADWGMRVGVWRSGDSEASSPPTGVEPQQYTRHLARARAAAAAARAAAAAAAIATELLDGDMPATEQMFDPVTPTPSKETESAIASTPGAKPWYEHTGDPVPSNVRLSRGAWTRGHVPSTSSLTESSMFHVQRDRRAHATNTSTWRLCDVLPVCNECAEEIDESQLMASVQFNVDATQIDGGRSCDDIRYNYHWTCLCRRYSGSLDQMRGAPPQLRFSQIKNIEPGDWRSARDIYRSMAYDPDGQEELESPRAPLSSIKLTTPRGSKPGGSLFAIETPGSSLTRNRLGGGFSTSDQPPTQTSAFPMRSISRDQAAPSPRHGTITPLARRTCTPRRSSSPQSSVNHSYAFAPSPTPPLEPRES